MVGKGVKNHQKSSKIVGRHLWTFPNLGGQFHTLPTDLLRPWIFVNASLLHCESQLWVQFLHYFHPYRHEIAFYVVIRHLPTFLPSFLWFQKKKPSTKMIGCKNFCTEVRKRVLVDNTKLHDFYIWHDLTYGMKKRLECSRNSSW